MLSTRYQPTNHADEHVPVLFARGSAPSLATHTFDQRVPLCEQTLELPVRRDEGRLFLLLFLLLTVLFAVSAVISSAT